MRPTRFALITAALVALVTALPAAYVLSGPKWSSRTVNYYINPANADVSEAAAEAAIQAGASTWGSQSGADFRFYYMGRTTSTTLGNNGRNEMFFRDVDMGNTIAATYWWSSGGRLLDADIVYYDGGIRFFTGSSGCSNGLYLEDVSAHEFGHALGLGHSADPDSTMYPVINWCSTSGRSLNSDDLAGVEALYPASGAPPNIAPSVALTSPADGFTVVAPATVSAAATANDTDGSVVRVDFLVNGVVAASDTSAPYTATFTNVAAGVYALSAVAIDNGGATGTATARTITVLPAQSGPPASVSFVRTDTTTQGAWKSAYGSDGYAIVSDSTSLPSYVQVSASGQSTWTWATGTSDVRALERAGGGRVMAAWYGGTFSIDVNVTGTQQRQLAIYAADYDAGGRQQRLDLIDATTGLLLDSRTMTSFTAGQYLVWNVVGHVNVRVTRLSGPNAVISGVVLGTATAGGGGGGGGGSGTAAFVRTDAVTQGSWKGSYGSEGLAIAADATTLPADVQLTMTGQSQWTWMASTGDSRAMQRASGDRVMAAWYGSAFTIDVTVGGAQPRQVAIYAADYDNGGRQQRFDLLDGSTGAVLDSRTLSSFSGGQYLVWNIQGHVVMQVSRLSGANAVVSGVLIGAGGAAPAGASAAFLTTDNVTQGAWQGVYGSEGVAIAADITSLPAYALLTFAGQSSWTWAASTPDVRALQRSGTGRVMAAWYGASFTLDLSVNGQARQVAIYSADYDNGGRQQRVDLVDASTGAVLDSRMLTDFPGGRYLVWNIQGHVLARITSLAGANAVVSGVFFK